jgi:GntR family transcriptional regulator, N-acetylglucosamine utilization regulator
MCPALDAKGWCGKAMNVIIRRSALPLYYQLKEIMREKILSGEWKPGDQVPSERELCATYKLSRMTVRQAIMELVNEGVCYREQGRGTFVSQRKIAQQLVRLTGFTEDIRSRGQVPSTQVLSAQLIPADEMTAERLRIDVGQPVFRLERLRLADGEPLAIERSHLSFEGCEALVEEDLEHSSLYRQLETKCGIPLIEADQKLEAGLAGPEDAALLRIAPGSAVLYIRRITFTDRNQPVEYARSVYRGDKYTFFTHLKREEIF